MRIVYGLIIALCAASCGDHLEHQANIAAPRQAQQAALIGGTPSEAGTFAETGMIITESSMACTATLIAPDVLLTAAHCIPYDGTAVMFLPRELPMPVYNGRHHRVRLAVSHPDYNLLAAFAPLMFREPFTEREKGAVAMAKQQCGHVIPDWSLLAQFLLMSPLEVVQCLAELPPEIQNILGLAGADRSIHDIALMFLEEPIYDIAPAKLPEPPQRIDVGSFVTGVGYGIHHRNSWWRKPMRERYIGSMQVYAVTRDEIQVLPGSAMAAPGDSGGPLYLESSYEDDDAPGTVIGVTSRVMGGSSEVPSGMGWYTRVDPYVSWIHEEIKLQNRAFDR